MIEASFTYNFVYSSSTPQERGAVILYGLALVGTFFRVFGLAGWALSLLDARIKRPVRDVNLTLLIALAVPLDFVLVSLSGRAYPHYYMSLLPSLILASSYFIYSLMSSAKNPTKSLNLAQRKNKAILTLILILLVLPIRRLLPAAQATVTDALSNSGVPRVNVHDSYYGPLLDYMTKNFEPNRGLVIWGKDLTANWLSGRMVPSQHIFQEHFLVTGFASRELIEGYINDLVEAKPYIIDHTAGRIHLAPAINTPLGDLPFQVQPLYLFLHTEYCQIDVIEPYNWPVYEYCGKRD
jgi:hypothetical protein